MNSGLAAVVLAAGEGKRLRPLTVHRPKALCPVNNVPLVDLAIDRITPYTESVAVNVHHMRAQMEVHLAGRVHLSIEEPDALGTAGAIGQLRGWIGGRAALVVNADAWSTDDLAALVTGWDGERVRLLVVEDAAHGDFGRWRFAGASLMPWREVAALAPAPTGLYEKCWRRLHDAGKLELVPSVAPFVDCGTPIDYLAANLGASGGGSVVGEGAVVEGTLERSVVWPGGHVRSGEHLVASIRVGADLTVAAGGNSRPDGSVPVRPG